MLIDNGKQYRAGFCEAVENCIIGKITKEQALTLLKSRYNTELERIRVNEKNYPDEFHYFDGNEKLLIIQKNEKQISRATGKEINPLETYKNFIAEFEDCFD
ncbi:MAG: hypothetical protein FWG07_04105 [Treponema sp.]|nr:hypothetical protein [Treponema sp.]